MHPLPPPASKVLVPPADDAVIPEADKLITAFRGIFKDGSFQQISDNAKLVDFVKRMTGRLPADGSIDTKQIYRITTPFRPT